MSRYCIFCGNNKLTREHLLPKWIFDNQKYIKAISPTRYEASDMRSLKKEGFSKVRTLRHAVRSDDVVVKCVCASCNNGWLSQMEEKVKEITSISNINDIDSMTKNQNDLLILRWMFAKAIIFCHSLSLKSLLYSSFAQEVYLDKMNTQHYIHLDYALGFYDDVNASISKCKVMLRTGDITVLDNSIVFCIQLGKFYFRLLCTDKIYQNLLLPSDYQYISLYSDFNYKLYPTSSGENLKMGTDMEFYSFSQAICLCC